MCAQGDTTTAIINGKMIDVDRCIAALVIAINGCGVPTVASCCGHGSRPGNIALADGRELIIAADYAEGRAVDAAFPSIQGERPTHTKGETE